jgi:ribosomal protein S27AE
MNIPPDLDTGPTSSPTQPIGDLPTESVGEYWRWCPRCGHELHNEKCKFRCPRCHYFMSCADFD